MQVPFAEDVRNFPFPSLENLVSKKGERVTSHPYLPTEEQTEAMEHFVDAMNLMDAGEKDEDGYDSLHVHSPLADASALPENACRGSTLACPTTPPFTA